MKNLILLLPLLVVSVTSGTYASSNNMNEYSNMNESEKYIADTIGIWVRSGFYSLEDIQEMMEDIMEPDADEKKLATLAKQKIQQKISEEKEWPDRTDFDRLNDAFEEMWNEKIIALHNAGYTMSDGFSDVAEARATKLEAAIGFCFYHGQDLERAVEGEGLTLAFGDMTDSKPQSIAIGKRVVAILEKHGFKVEWNGDPEKRIEVLEINWRKRGV